MKAIDIVSSRQYDICYRVSVAFPVSKGSFSLVSTKLGKRLLNYMRTLSEDYTRFSSHDIQVSKEKNRNVEMNTKFFPAPPLQDKKSEWWKSIPSQSPRCTINVHGPSGWRWKSLPLSPYMVPFKTKSAANDENPSPLSPYMVRLWTRPSGKWWKSLPS